MTATIRLKDLVFVCLVSAIFIIALDAISDRPGHDTFIRVYWLFGGAGLAFNVGRARERIERDLS